MRGWVQMTCTPKKDHPPPHDQQSWFIKKLFLGQDWVSSDIVNHTGSYAVFITSAGPAGDFY